MHSLIVRKDGLYYDKKKVDTFIPFLSRPIEVAIGVTFEDFFSYVMKDAEAFTAIFASDLGWFDLTAWQKEWDKEAEEMDKQEGNDYMSYLEVRIDGEIHEDEFYLVKTFHGIGMIEGQKGGYSVSFSGLNKLKKYPFTVNNEFKAYVWETNKELFKKEYPVTVYEVIGAILDDISFYGEPEERDEAITELNRRVDEVKEKLDRGEEVGIPAEEVFERLKEKMKDNGKDEE